MNTSAKSDRRPERLARSRLGPILLMLFIFSAATVMFDTGPVFAAPGDTMIHNSTNTTPAGHTRRWDAQGGWGITGGKYGQFDCGTCHDRNTTNIKRVKSTITTPDPSKGRLPGDTGTGVSVIFDRIIGAPGTGMMGDDSATRTQSTHICEVCHTYDAAKVNGVNVHASNQSVAGNHQDANGKDCIACHRHNEAFKPLDCNVCHGNPPDDTHLTNYDGKTTGSTTAGKHATHATTLAYACDNCHSNSVMPQDSTVKPGYWDISIGFSNFGSTTGSYSGQNGLSYNNVLSTATGADQMKCSTVYCHGGTLDGANKTPTWTGTVACGDCHKNNAAAMASTALGSHARHAGNGASGLGLACTDCHGTNGSGGAGHVTGTVQYDLSGNTARFGAIAKYNSQASGTINNTAPSATYQSCSTVYCHSPAQSATGGALVLGDYKTVQWGGGTLNCGSCHPNMSGVSGTGSHVKHANAYAISCGTCHTGYTSSSTNSAAHANATIDVNVGSYTGGTVAGNHAPGGGYGSCSNIYCHSSGQSSTGGPLAGGDYKTVTWGIGPLTCASCHNDMSVAGGTGTHQLHAVNAGYACSVCHGTGYSSSTVVTTTHDNGTINVAFTGNGTGTTYSGDGTPGNGYGSCSTSNCHGSGTITWGGDTLAPECEKCHGSAATAALGSFKATSGSTDPTNAKVGAHVAHLASTSNISADIACSECHVVPAGVNDAGHMNGTTTMVAGIGYNAVSGSCSTTYCHGDTLAAGGSNTTPTWNDTLYLGNLPLSNADCGKCHGYPPTGSHPADSNCNKCHNEVNVDNHSFANAMLHIDHTVQVSADFCVDCHSSLSATHAKHTDAGILAGKKLSTNDYGQDTWFYNVTYSAGTPQFACGYCHPNTTATHMKGSVDLDVDPTHAPVGNLVKSKNSATTVITRTPGVSVTCGSVYCHSNGYNNAGYAYTTTPDWFGGSFTGDKCSNCHGNSPNSGGKAGSAAHGAHVVGIHYQDVFSGTTGKAAATGGVGSGAAHGDPATSTTINCNVCHSGTVAVNTNDNNTVCVTCHTGASAKGAVAISATSTTHINGTPDVSFGTFSVKTKAQVRNDITTVAELNSSWTRTNGYKAASSYDASKGAPSYAGGTCSTVACHNGISVGWTDTISCKSCHTALPK